LTIELQKLRSDLYFLHAAVLGFKGKACLLVAPSGGGKSLTTWGVIKSAGLVSNTAICFDITHAFK